MRAIKSLEFLENQVCFLVFGSKSRLIQRASNLVRVLHEVLVEAFIT